MIMETLPGIATTNYGTLLLWVAIGYLSGSVPYGLLIARAFGLGNLREIGSGNIGATNVLRTGSKPAAAATLLLDALKGTLPVMAALTLAGMTAAILTGMAAFLGHIFPVWLKFKGGKGVATYVGVLLGLGWKLLLVFAIVWLSVAVLTRYSSLAALLASVAVPAYAAYTQNAPLALALAAMTIIVFATHRANIARLFRGEESRIGAKAGR
jgi:acyl phosphate:glycerol-3-phosphate acyltransferase